MKKAEPERLSVISIKYKKTGHEENVSVGKRRDEKRVLESCPKRIKVRGPSISITGLETKQIHY